MVNRKSAIVTIALMLCASVSIFAKKPLGSPTTQGTTAPTSAPVAQSVELCRAELKRAQDDQKQRINGDRKYQSLVESVNDLEGKLADARKVGTTAEKIAASSAYNRARRARDDYLAQLLKDDSSVADAQRRLDLSIQVQQKEKAQADMRESEADQRKAEVALAPRDRAKRDSATYEAAQIIAVYDQNEVKADESLKGKWFKVRGTVLRVGKDILDVPYVAIESEKDDEIRVVQCTFEKTDGLSDLKKGQKVVIFGKCAGLSINVVLEECEIIP